MAVVASSLLAALLAAPKAADPHRWRRGVRPDVQTLDGLHPWATGVSFATRRLRRSRRCNGDSERRRDLGLRARTSYARNQAY
jgi:hypothetical protein